MLKFITGKPLWVNILIGCAIFFILVFLLFQSLSMVTRHSAVLPVPAVTGKSFDEAKKLLEGQGFDVQVQDTVFSDTVPLLSVVNQFPDAQSIVKENRTVFLTINSPTLPDVAMPNLEGASFKSAEITLQQLKLKIEDTVYKTYFAPVVMEQQFKGQRIQPGTKIPVGSGIVLVIGTGVGSEAFDVPDMFGLTLSEARAMAESAGLTIQSVIPQGADPNSYVYKQNPDHLSRSGNVNKIRQGQFMDLWVQPDKPVRQSAPPADSAASNSGY